MDRRASPSGNLPRPSRLEIQVITLREERENPDLTAVRDVVSLKQLLDKYTLSLGLQNANLLEIATTLLTTGKVCVEFRTYHERLQLQNIGDAMSRLAAVDVFNEYLIRSKETKHSAKESTRRITVQLPKIVIPAADGPHRAPPVP